MRYFPKIKLIENEEYMDEKDKDIVFKKVNEVQYLVSILSVKNDWSREI